MSRCAFCPSELTTGDIDGVCVSCRNAGFSQLFKPTPNYGQSGWMCPRCGQVNAPWKPKCDCPPPSITTTDTQIKINFP